MINENINNLQASITTHTHTHHKLSDVCNLSNLCKIEFWNFNTNAAVENWKYNFFTCWDKILKIDTYTHDCEAILLAWNWDISNIKIFKWKFSAYQKTYILSNFKDEILPKYLYYYLNNFYIKYALNLTKKWSIPYIKSTDLSNFKIKVPSLETQQKIVNILDKMNTYCNDVNDWLLKEYNLLEKQYKYYLNKLLQLENLNEKDIYIYKLNELIDFIKWVHYDKHDEVDESVKDNYDYYKVLRWNNINVNNTLNLDEEIKLINKDSKKMKFKEDYCLKEKDILLVCASINYLWKCAYIDKDSDYLFSWFLWVLRNNNKNNYISKLLYYYITSKYFKNYLDDNANWTTFNNLNNTLINNFKVRFPKSLDEQQHIVDILDKFSQLKNQLKNEIELRNKQYKYYLNKLLTFENI